MNTTPHIVLLLLAGGLFACNEGSDNQPKEAVIAGPAGAPNQASPWAYHACNSAAGVRSAPADAAADGIWAGTLTNERSKRTEPWSALVSADGRFHLLSSGHTQMAGMLDVNGNAYTGTGIARSGGTGWHDGKLVSELTLAGTIAERSRLNGDFALASGDAGCFRFVYDANRYERPSSLDFVNGHWQDYDDWSFLWLTLDVSPDGAFTGLSIYGCSYAGSIMLLDERFNLYAVAVDITQRTDMTYGCWAPGSYEGFAYLEDTGDGALANHYLHLAVANGETARRFTLNR